MVLQSLIRGSMRIQDMSREVLPDSSQYDAEGLLRLLKKTSYDQESRLWVTSNTSPSSEASMKTQLLGILAEGVVNNSDVEPLYKQLTRSKAPLHVMVASPPSSLSDCLLACLIVRQFDPAEAKRAFKYLKKKEFTEYWREFHNDGANSFFFRAHTGIQLLGAYVESLFDRRSAYSFYDVLKSWSEYHIIEHPLDCRSNGIQFRECLDQLFGILGISVFNPKEAALSYERLKETQLYNSKRREWFQTESFYGGSGISIPAQLLAVIIEARLADLNGGNDTGSIPPMPNVRRF